MKRCLSFVICAVILCGCSELELGSHLVKQIPFPSDPQKSNAHFKVGKPYVIKGRTYRPKEKYRFTQTGIASWYGPGFHGKLTANGEIFNKYELTAAHKTLQLPSIVRVTNLNNGRSLVVRVNDRGPFSHNRIIDLSERAAELLGFKSKGIAKVRIEVMEEESRIVGSAAKRGLSTRGSEVALNRNRGKESLAYLAQGMSLPYPTQKPEPYLSDTVMMADAKSVSKRGTFPSNEFESMVLAQAKKPARQIKGHNVKGNFYPDPVITRKPVSSLPQNIFVEAGSFSSEDDALTLKMGLYNISEPVQVIHTPQSNMYTVTIGPIKNVNRADEILKMLNRKGREAEIVIAQN